MTGKLTIQAFKEDQARLEQKARDQLNREIAEKVVALFVPLYLELAVRPRRRRSIFKLLRSSF